MYSTIIANYLRKHPESRLTAIHVHEVRHRIRAAVDAGHVLAGVNLLPDPALLLLEDVAGRRRVSRRVVDAVAVGDFQPVHDAIPRLAAAAEGVKQTLFLKKRKRQKKISRLRTINAGKLAV